MQTTHSLPSVLSDRDLLAATVRAAGLERRATVDLITLLSEVDARRLYLAEGCSSLFTYCTQVLHLSEHAAYHRIEATRTAREFPVVLELLGQGALTLTTVTLLGPHLTCANHIALLEAARGKTKREVEHQVACLAPRPDATPVLRRIPQPAAHVANAKPLAPEPTPSLLAEPVVTPSSRPRPVIAPIAESRYVIKVTVSADTHARLRRAQDLLRHAIPDGDPAAVLDRALTLLVDQLERRKFAKAFKPRQGSAGRPRSTTRTRRIPARVRREVWTRDQGRCRFEGAHGRCTEISRLEFHHVIPFADGGPTTADNLSLRCQAHNQFEAERWNGSSGAASARRPGPSGS